MCFPRIIALMKNLVISDWVELKNLRKKNLEQLREN